MALVLLDRFLTIADQKFQEHPELLQALTAEDLHPLLLHEKNWVRLKAITWLSQVKRSSSNVGPQVATSQDPDRKQDRNQKL